MFEVKLKITRSLIYYDGPVLSLGKDEAGANYLINLVDRNENADEFLAVQIAPEKIVSVVSGKSDLFEVFKNCLNGAYFKLVIENYSQDYFVASMLGKDEVSEESFPLPDTQIIIGNPIQDSPELVNQSIIQNTAVVEFSLNPPESIVDHAISPYTLAAGLVLFQNLLKYSFRKAVSSAQTNGDTRKDLIENYGTEVLAFAQGSFKIIFRAKSPADITGYVELEKGLNKLDTLLENLDDTNFVIENLKENRGHLFNNYSKLIKFIIDNESPISYQWFAPKSTKVHKRYISKKNAVEIYNRIGTLKGLGNELLDVYGEFTKVNTKTNSWTILDVEGKAYSGTLNTSRKKSLKGVVAGNQKYKFKLEEVVEEVEVTGKEKISYFLINFSKSNKDSKKAQQKLL